MQSSTALVMWNICNCKLFLQDPRKKKKKRKRAGSPVLPETRAVERKKVKKSVTQGEVSTTTVKHEGQEGSEVGSGSTRVVRLELLRNYC
jgi:hypothetical protein